MKSFPLVLASILLTQLSSLGAQMPKVGDAAPDFFVAASNGKTVHLKDYVGKGNIILYFYPKDDTPGCTKEACGIRDTFEEFKGLNATVFGVSFDSVESHKKFIEKYKLLPSKCIMVGDMGGDKSFAARCGFQYVDANDFFK